MRPLRVAIVAAVCVWAGMNLIDHTRLLVASARTPPLNEHRVLTDYLLSHEVRYARAIYRDAYVVDFLSRERLVVASSDIVRIPE